jgi:hypothetical protein
MSLKMPSSIESLAVAKIRKWRQDPVFFVRDQFGIEPDEWQKEVLMAFANKSVPRIAMEACVGPGKSCVEAWIAWNFLCCYGSKGEHPKGAAVSVTADNLKDNLWPEIAKWQGRSKFLSKAYTWTKERIFLNEHPETWFISARSFSKTADPETQGRTLSGLHSKYLLYLIDESGDIHPAVLRAAEQGLSNVSFGKIVQAGNPTSHDGMLYLAAVSQRDKWFVVRITGDPEDPRRSPRIDIQWAAEQIKQYGRDNPWVMASILGQFPPSSINSLLSIQDVEDSMRRVIREDEISGSQKRLGVDVARFGDDRTVIFPRQGLVAFKYADMRNANSHEVAARVAKAKNQWGSEQDFLDVTGGYGGGVEDALKMAGFNPFPVNFAGKAADSRYFNLRSEMWFRMAEWVKRGSLPNIPTLARELTAPTYTFVGGKFRLEEKDQIKKRLGHSPDAADALACTFALPDMPSGEAAMPQFIGNRYAADYDPFDEKRMALS